MMTSHFVHKMLALALVVTTGLIANLIFAPAADAQVELRTDLTLVAGEEPTAPGAIAPAGGDARFVPPDRLRIGLSGMDPLRFPASDACSADVRIGPVSAKVVPVLVPAADPANEFGVDVTAVDLRAAGVARPGDSAQIRVRCRFVDAAGVRQRHETQWSGTLAPR